MTVAVCEGETRVKPDAVASVAVTFLFAMAMPSAQIWFTIFAVSKWLSLISLALLSKFVWTLRRTGNVYQLTPRLDETRRHSLDHGFHLAAHAANVFNAAAMLRGAAGETLEGAFGELALQFCEGGVGDVEEEG